MNGPPFGHWRRELAVVVGCGGSSLDTVVVVVGVAVDASAVSVVAVPMIILRVGITTPSAIHMLFLLCA